ncbi:MAG TPA: sigma-70 family RNA polymerase sigma factor [Candidatus Dormibacteraeota bacterium]|jgi:RNA polymerase sigma-70 factor (ECF subfamily)
MGLSAGIDLAAAVAGDTDAFASLVRPVLEPAYRLALGFLGEREMAEDAVQEATLRAWRRLRDLRSEDSFRAWYLQVVANECRRLRRKRRWPVRQPSDIASLVVEPPEHAVTADIDLSRALSTLTPDERQVVVLRYSLDLPLDEVAAVAAIPVGTVKSRLHRALSKLRPLLEIAEEPS